MNFRSEMECEKLKQDLDTLQMGYFRSNFGTGFLFFFVILDLKKSFPYLSSDLKFSFSWLMQISRINASDTIFEVFDT